MSECSCWVKYPNPMHKGKNGKWKCVDDYECIQDLQTVETPIGLTAVRRKTHCRRKTEEKQTETQEAVAKAKALQDFCESQTCDACAFRENLKEEEKWCGLNYPKTWVTPRRKSTKRQQNHFTRD